MDRYSLLILIDKTMSGVVFFDVDNVLIKGQSQLYLVRFLLKNKRVSILFFIKICSWFFFYKFFSIDTKSFRHKALLVFKGWDVRSTKILFKIFYEEEIKPRLIRESVNIIRFHKEKNREVVLISASLKEIVDLIAKDLGIKDVIATNLEICDGFYTGKIIGNVPYGKQKLPLAQQFIGALKNKNIPTFAYSDHISDKELLKYVRNPYVVNPDKLLNKLSIKNNWPILHLK